MMDIKDEIINFIERKEETGALLITGKWGSGKTFYIKNLVEEFNKEKKGYLSVISLFGINTVENLTKVVKECYLEANSTIFTKTARKIGKIVGKTVNSGLKVAEAATGGNVAVSAAQKGFSSVISLGLLDFISVKNYIGRGKSQRKFVLVFDDLERCKINMVDLLGVINEYCENRNIKTIILAAEDVILKNEENIKKVVWEEGGTKKEASIKEQIRSVSDYQDFKEKVVFQTIKFELSYIDTIGLIIDKYKESKDGYVVFLKRNSTVIKQVFTESKYDNLRTIKTIITNFERVYGAWCKAGIVQDALPKILYAYAAKYFEYKPVEQHDESKSFQKLIEKYSKPKSKENSMPKYNGDGVALSSLDLWMKTSKFDEDAVIEELNKLYNPDIITDKFKVLHWSIFDLDAETTVKGLKDALKDAYNGFLDADEYVGLIDRLQYYKVYQLPFNDVDYDKLSRGIDKYIERSKNREVKEEMHFHVSSEIMRRANSDTKSLLEKLEYIEYNHNYWELRNNLLEALKEKSDFLYNLNIHALEELDDELLDVFKKTYQEGENRRKRELEHIILLRINYTMDMLPTGSTNSFAKSKRISAMGATIKNFEVLIDWLKKQSEIETDIITKMVLNQFSIDIQGKLTQLNQDLDNFKQKYDLNDNFNL